MDPNQTFSDMLEAMESTDLETARQLALALKHWLRRGGFYPAQATQEKVDVLIESVLRGKDWTEC